MGYAVTSLPATKGNGGRGGEKGITKVDVSPGRDSKGGGVSTTIGVGTVAADDEVAAFSVEVTMIGDARREIIDSGGMTPPRRNRGTLNIARESDSKR